MRKTTVAALVAAIVVGSLAIVLAHDVRAWNDTLGAGALRASRFPSAQVRSTPSTALPSSVSASLLSVGRDRQWLAAVQRFTIAYQTTENADALGPGSYALLHNGETALAKVTQDPNTARASQAYNLLAVLVFRSAYPGTGVDAGFVQEALTDLQNAVRLDQGNEPAKQNLELALRVLSSAHSIVPTRGAGNQVTHRRKGGYGGPPGFGY
jgi:hypothetical protein